MLQISPKILVTGGAGFIGSAMIRQLLQETDSRVLNLDKLTYAACLPGLEEFRKQPNYEFIEADICDGQTVSAAMGKFQPDAVIHAAAESHVDRSISGPAEFITTNLVGTYSLLEATRAYWERLPTDRQGSFRFVQVSTDEVYGTLGDKGQFTERTSYDPRNPYSASKAGSDHLAMAWFHTFGLPTIKTHSCNNFGPYQFPEKLIPVVIYKALQEEKLTIYGTGDNVRDWLHVDDHVRALRLVLEQGRVGETYNIGGNHEKTNLELVCQVCDVLDHLRPRLYGSYRDLIAFVEDRPGHDKRYAIDAQKISGELGWKPLIPFEEGLAQTVQWYLESDWCFKQCKA